MVCVHPLKIALVVGLCPKYGRFITYEGAGNDVPGDIIGPLLPLMSEIQATGIGCSAEKIDGIISQVPVGSCHYPPDKGIVIIELLLQSRHEVIGQWFYNLLTPVPLGIYLSLFLLGQRLQNTNRPA